MRRPDDQNADVRELDRLLSSIRFGPRASLGPELLGRIRKPDQSSPRRIDWLRSALGVSGVVVALAFAVGSARQLMIRYYRTHTIDHCCQDLDGGGVADDGILVQMAGDQVRRLSIYEDRDHSRGFTRGDTLRFSRAGPPVMLGALGGVMKTAAFCCVDYDGGGSDDDGLIVIERPPDQISMAAIYEWRPGVSEEYPLR